MNDGSTLTPPESWILCRTIEAAAEVLAETLSPLSLAIFTGRQIVDAAELAGKVIGVGESYLLGYGRDRQVSFGQQFGGFANSDVE